jgi:ABC-2 type transport system permease protein
VSTVLNSEWTKLRSVRSTSWTIATTVVITIGISALVSGLKAGSWKNFSASDKAAFDPTNGSLLGLTFGALVIGVIGALAICSEYGSGTMATTLSAVPRRWSLLRGKAVVVGLVTLALGETITLVAFLIGQSLLSGHAPHASLGDPGVVRAIALSGAALAALALFAHGLGYLIRNVAGTIGAFVGLFLVLPTVMSALPSSIQNATLQFTPLYILSSSVSATIRQPHSLGPWAGIAMLAVYAVMSLGLGGMRLVRSDA